MNNSPWSPSSWRQKPILQQPDYQNSAHLAAVTAQISQLPPLVSAREIHKLRSQLAQVAHGKAFLLQGGDCAESFKEFNQDNLLAYFRVMLQMAITLVYGVAKPVVKVGRVAGQFAKPRSAASETQEGVTLPAYRGDMINGAAFSSKDREPNPKRLLHAYWQSSATLNYLHSLARDGYASLGNVAKWNSEFASHLPGSERFKGVIARIHEYVAFVEACGLSTTDTEQLASLDFYTSHEALMLDYEQALTRTDEQFNEAFDCSAHMLWLGNRTRQVDGAHVEYARGIGNPIGIKISGDIGRDALLALLDILNPQDTPGRIVLITRMGAANIDADLPPLIETVKTSGRTVVWSCDPMHGNTIKSSSGYKTRRFDDILAEVQAFFRIHHAAGTYPGGLHFEMTGQDVTECTGGRQVISDEDLNHRYHTHCDPRLNASQALELAFLAAENLHQGSN